MKLSGVLKAEECSKITNLLKNGMMRIILLIEVNFTLYFTL